MIPELSQSPLILNIRQRGIGNPNAIKLGRCIKELERIYEIREGSAGNSHTNYFNGSSDLKTEKDLLLEEHMMKCNKCGGSPKETDKMAWKCTSCGKTYGVKLP